MQMLFSKMVSIRNYPRENCRRLLDRLAVLETVTLTREAYLGKPQVEIYVDIP